MLTSVVIGLLTALCAVVLKNSVHFIQQWVHQVSIAQNSHYLLFIFPTIGILLTVFYTQVFRNGELGRGVTNIIFSISRRSSYVEKDKLYSQMLSSILTVGFGGSAGLEAPIASTGSAIGSNTAKWLHFNLKERTLLLACGTAAGISAIFNAPIAGVIFAFENTFGEYAYACYCTIAHCISIFGIVIKVDLFRTTICVDHQFLGI